MAETVEATPDALDERVVRLPELREQLGSDDAEAQLSATLEIRRMVSVGTCAFGAGVHAWEWAWVSSHGRTGVVSSSQCAGKALCVTGRCACVTGDDPPIQSVIDAGVVPPLVEFLSHQDTSTDLLVRLCRGALALTVALTQRCCVLLR